MTRSSQDASASPSEAGPFAPAEVPIERDALWDEANVEMLSVGIDIGSAGTQVIMSRLHLRRIVEHLSTRYVVIARESVYRSPVSLTPFAENGLIDEAALGTIIDRAYHQAGISSGKVDTGAVILTGEALRRQNAERIARQVADRAEALLTASAGHHMEAMIAAFGSGAAEVSHDRGLRILNVDIGGGTTKLAVLEHGRIASTAAISVGGRLLAFDHGRVTRLEPAGKDHAAAAGVDIAVGGTIAEDAVEAIAEAMADAVTVALSQDDDSAPWLTPPPSLEGVTHVMFSGGVAEYIYEREQDRFGDLGPYLGAAIRRRIDEGSIGYELLPAGQCIRATVLGAAEHTVQLSGSTIHLSDADALLPRRDLPVIRPEWTANDGPVDLELLATRIRAALDAHAEGHEDANGDLVLALNFGGAPEYGRLHAFATGVSLGMAELLDAGRALHLIVDRDIALTLGKLLVDEIGVTAPLLVLDGLRLVGLDHIDLGTVRQPSNTVPVTIKSMLFEGYDQSKLASQNAEGVAP